MDSSDEGCSVESPINISREDMFNIIKQCDFDFIKRLKVILEVLASGFEIDTEKLSSFLQSTAELYVSLYSWYPMTPTLHKILTHGALVIKHALLPIGQLSEEAAEARNKHLYRQNFARKFSRRKCNEDVMNRLLLTSGVYLNCSRMKIGKNRKPFSTEALEFLKQDERVSTISREYDDEVDGDDDEDSESDF